MDTTAPECFRFIATLPPAGRYVLAGCSSAIIGWDGRQIVITVSIEDERRAIARVFAHVPIPSPYRWAIVCRYR